jgi:hypothetical protein
MGCRQRCGLEVRLAILPCGSADRSSQAAFFAYSDNYLIDVKFGVIVDVEA